MNTFTLGLIVIGYLLSLAYLGFLGYKKTTNTSDYLVGGRQMNPIVMALSYGATFISASASSIRSRARFSRTMPTRSSALIPLTCSVCSAATTIRA